MSSVPVPIERDWNQGLLDLAEDFLERVRAGKIKQAFIVVSDGSDSESVRNWRNTWDLIGAIECAKARLVSECDE